MPDLYKNIVYPSASITANNVHIGDVISAIETLNPKTQSFEKPTLYLQRHIFQFRKAPQLQKHFAGHRQSCNVMEELNRHTRIVLIGDAGMGKTTELERICYDLQESRQYYPVLRLLRNYRRSEGNLPIFPHFHLPPECLEEQEKFVLVLDGLDEPEMHPAKQAIEKFASDYPNSKVLVSCRSNAYSDTLQGFEEYYLGKLAYSEIQRYVQEKLEHFSDTFLQYWRDKYAWNQNQLIDNPFFLVHICEFIRGNDNRPPNSLGEVFEYLINESLNLRLKSFGNIGEGDLEGLRKACRKSLEKLAFVMECRGENVISKAELEQLIGDKNEREVLLKKSSLIEFQDNSWRFAHNNFQEYLAAKALARAKNFKAIKEALAAKPDFQRLKWTWVNALSFLMGLWRDDNPKKKQLLDWLAKNDLEPLIKICSFERDKVSPDVREHVFKLVFEKCKKEDTIVGSHYYSYWDMAEFGESPETIRFLIEELRTAKTPIVKGNALVLLKSMNAYSVPSDVRASLRAELFRNIYDFEVNSPPDRHYAMEALFQLFADLTNEEAVKMVETFFNSENAQERAASYRLIEKQKLQIYFMEQLIVRIQQLEDYNWQKGRALRSDEDVHIEDCFKDLEGEEVLVTFFEKYPVIVENKWDSRLNLILEKLANSTLSQQGAKRIFEVMKKWFSDWLAHPTETKKEAIITFIEKNGLRFEFFKSCIEENEIRVMWVSTSFLNEEGIIFLVDKFKKGDLDRQWMSEYQKCVGIHKKELLPPLNQRLNDAAEEPFSLPVIKPPIDSNQRQNEKLLAEKALYFNQEKYIAVIEKIFADFGKESFGKNEIYDRYPNKLIGMIDDHPLT